MENLLHNGIFQLDYYIIDSVDEDKKKEREQRRKRGRMSTKGSTLKSNSEGSRAQSLNDVRGEGS